MQTKLLKRFGTMARDEQLVGIRHELRQANKKPLGHTVLKREDLERITAASSPPDEIEEVPLECTPTADLSSADIPTADAPSTLPSPAPLTAPMPPTLPPPPTMSIPPVLVPAPVRPPADPPVLKVVSHDGTMYERAMNLVPAPGATKSREDSRIRFDWCREYLGVNPRARNSDVVDACRKIFGIGIDGRAMGDIRRILGIGIIKQRSGESHRKTRPPAPVGKMILDSYVDPPGKTFVPLPTLHVSDSTANEAIKAAIGMLLEEVPNLRSLTVTFDDEGEPDVSFSLATVVSGKVQL